MFVWWNFGTNLLFELCPFDCYALLDTKLSDDGKVVLFQSVATCLRPSSAGCLSEPVVTVIGCGSFVCRPRQGRFCSRPAVSVPFSVAFITDLTNIKACNSMRHCGFARLASASVHAEGAGGSSKILPLRIMFVSRGCNCTVSFTKTYQSFRDEKNIRWKADSKQVRCEQNDRKRQSSRFPRAGIKSVFTQMKRFSTNQSQTPKRPSWMQWPGKFAQKAAYLWRAGSTKDYANMPTGLQGLEVGLRVLWPG